MLLYTKLISTSLVKAGLDSISGCPPELLEIRFPAIAARIPHPVIIACITTICLVTAFYLLLRFATARSIQKILFSHRVLEQEIARRTQELTESQKTLEAAHTELVQILNSASGGMRVLDRQCRTIRVNKQYETLTGLKEQDILGKFCYQLSPHKLCRTERCPLQRILNGEKQIEMKMEVVHIHGKTTQCYCAITPFHSPEGEILGIIEDFRDISTVERLLNIQQINIKLAQRILGLINAGFPRYIEMNNETILFSSTLFSLCNSAGGDHFSIRRFQPDFNYPQGRISFSLKDQSGHEVGCILKSIATDYIHSVILRSPNRTSLNYEVNRLNTELCSSTLFHEDDFITGILGDIDNATMSLNYISCGHPPFMLIRDGQVRAFPQTKDLRHLPLAVHPETRFTSERIRLQQGDQLLFYTDGLTEMPRKNTGKVISTSDLEEICRTILLRNPSIRVLELMNQVLAQICRISGEEVIPFLKNSSDDDVTLLGLEIEDQAADFTRILHIRDSASLSRQVEELFAELCSQAKQHQIRLDAYHLRTILDESISNAWKHGHGCSPDKPIRVTWRFRNDFHLEIIDLGNGFDWTRITNPTIQENRRSESGRGLFLIRLFAEHVTWKDHGRHIHMVLKSQVQQDRRNSFRNSKAVT